MSRTDRYDEDKLSISFWVKLVLAVFVFLFGGLPIMFGSWYTIDQRERGVLLRNGALIGIAQPGLGFKMPWIDSVVVVNLETINSRWKKLGTYSRDQQPAEIDISINWRATADAADDLYVKYGGLQGVLDRAVTPKVLEELKTVFGRFNAITAVQERGRLNNEVGDAIIKAVQEQGAPILIESVQIENIDFSKAYEASIEQRMLAEVEVERLRQNLEREKVQADIVRTQASGAADQVRAAALAESEAIKLRGNAEAEAISARAKALAQNPALVALVQAERWDGKLPVTMVPGGGVPLLSIGSK